MKKTLLLFAITLISFNVYCQEESNTVMVKSVEVYGNFAAMKRSLHVIDEKGKTTTTELEKHNSKGIPLNMSIVKKTLDHYLNKGYKIISSTATSFGDGVYTIEHTYIFEKKSK